MSTCGALHQLFVPPPSDVKVIKDDAVAIVVQSSPTLGTMLFLLLLSYRGRRSLASQCVKNAVDGVALAVIVANGILSWRTFELLECDDVLTGAYKAFAIASAVACAILSFGIVRVRPLSVVGLFLLAAGGAVFADWTLRGGVVVSPGGYYLVAVQETFCLLAVLAIYHTSRRTAKTRVLSATRTPVPDALVRRPVDASASAPPTRSWLLVP